MFLAQPRRWSYERTEARILASRQAHRALTFAGNLIVRCAITDSLDRRHHAGIRRLGRLARVVHFQR